MPVNRNKWPPMVRMALLGIPSRSAAIAFVWISAALAIAGIAYGFINRIGFLLGGLMPLASAWYWLSIRWVDRHSRWK